MRITLQTWPYGTQRTGVVCIAQWHPKELPPDVADGQLIRDNLGEMHACVGDECADFTAKEGDTGTLTFVRGCPTRGFWEFHKS